VSAAVVPQLSTIAISGFRLGNETAEMLINVLSGRSKGSETPDIAVHAHAGVFCVGSAMQGIEMRHVGKKIRVLGSKALRRKC